VGVEKLFFTGLAKSKIAPRCPTNDLLNFLDIFVSLKIWLFGKKLVFFNSHEMLQELPML